MLRERLKKELLIFDGAMGSMLQKYGMKAGEIPEVYNIEHPEMIIDIHKQYLKAGAHFITTNTFGCNPLKMQESGYCYCDLLKAAVKNAKKARDEVNPDAYIVLDIGPIGQLLEPLGTLRFDEAYEMIASQVLMVKDDVDAVLLETMTDLYEVKAGILAVKENSDLPVFVTMTFEAHQRTLTGTDPLTFVNVVEGLKVDALGVNCSLGPVELLPIVKTILKYASVPVIVQPNAGLPCLEHGHTCYPMKSDEFVEAMKEYAQLGVNIIGGCCGTTPEFIAGLKEHLPSYSQPREVLPYTAVSSAHQTVLFEGQVVVCGERLNPTGKKKLKAALKEGNYEEYVKEAIQQQRAGADILDVNVGLPGIDEKQVMVTVLKMLQEVIDLPLQIDSSSPEVIEKACRYYNGKPLINSVNAKEEVMEAIFPIVQKYGGVVIGLTLQDGIPLYADERLALAKKIIQKAKTYQIPSKDIIIDCLTLTASAQQKEVQETLKAVSLVKNELSLYTTLGVSNVSFGLPHRPLLNRTFLALALQAGLNLPIINPLDQQLMDTIDAYRVLSYQDKDAIQYIEKQSQHTVQPILPATDFTLHDIIIHGLKDEVKAKTQELLQTKQALEIIDQIIIPALNQVGDDYEKNRIFLPQLIQSAETTKLAFEVIKSTFHQQDAAKATVVMCTVEGDVHDIGKNIVKVILESYGYQVIDLGKDVKKERVVEAYQQYHPQAIGLSALMTTTVVHMQKTIQALKEAHCDCPIWVGGAVLTADIAREIGADYYCQDAMATVTLLQDIL
ncbi:homocysteine S-methyltransferase family protein [Massilimicrobiota timonensis]|uniref:homocysteine S-methyltransferase family protein n=1 Tax=Massilimicrobiota timonensis TaxID=1776392 RepID=UPI00196012F8|nr:homocysteine S-methyltransferase family protein [Massilimicrobiota timonensis]MBM6966475.1 homocysteine S-methyltransferase family protein [Massilimicrobiota timonensis]